MVDGIEANAIDVSEAALTLREADPVTPPRVAWIIVDPAETPVANGFEAELGTVATAVLVLVQFASPVMFCVVPSLNVPTAE
jgi:hypothetical protein